MIEVYLNGKVVFKGTEKEVERYCETHEWDYTQDTCYEAFEKMCGIY